MWALGTARWQDRPWLPDDYHFFKLLPVAVHEIGHVLGLEHTFGPSDVMNPYYLASRIELSEADTQALQRALA